jgi:hypothetical protein
LYACNELFEQVLSHRHLPLVVGHHLSKNAQLW